MTTPTPSADDAGRAPEAALDLRFVGHATVLLDIAGVRVLTDPFLRDRLGPLERHGPVPDPRDLGAVDVVLISHGHPDHFDRASLASIPGHPLVVVPRGLGGPAMRAVGGEVVEVGGGDRLDLGGLGILAVPARHWITPGSPRAEPIGYLLDGGLRVYFAGDTGPFAGMPALIARSDVALLPVWTWGPHLGPGHLGPRAAAEVLVGTGAGIAIPIHWGTLYPRRLHRVWRGPLQEPGSRFAVDAAHLAPDVEVRVLRPGESTAVVSGPRSPRSPLPRSR